MRSFTKNRSTRSVALAAAAAAGLSLSASSAFAQTWALGNAAGIWNSSASWMTPSTVPNAVGAAVSFPAMTVASPPRNVTFTGGSAYTVGTFNFDSTGAAGPTTIGATDETTQIVLDNAGSGAKITETGTNSFSAANYINFRAPVVLNDNLTVDLAGRTAGTSDLSFLGATQDVSGNFNFIKTGLGTVSFADNFKTYTGTTTVNNGRFRVSGNATNLGGVGLSAIRGTTAVTVTSDHTTHIGGQLDFDTADTGGTATNNFGPKDPIDGTFKTIITLNGIGFNGNNGAIRVETNRVTSLANPIVLGSGATATDPVMISEGGSGTNLSSKLTLTGAVSGSAPLISNSNTGGFAGELVLAGNNTYTGGTTVNNGKLTVTSATGLGNVANSLTVNNINTTQIVAPNTQVVVSLFNGSATSVGTLSGTTSTPPTNGINTTTINNPSGLNVTQGADATFDGTIAGAGSLAKAGANTLTLSGNNTYTGGTTINAGRLQATKANALPSQTATVNNGGTLGVNAGAASGQWADTEINTAYNNSTFASGSKFAIDTTGGNFTYSQGFSGNKSNGFEKIGANSLTLSGVGTYTGGTTVSGGTLVAANADALGGGALSVATGAVAQAQASLPKALTLASVTTAGTGKLDLTNNSMVVRSSTLAAVQASIASGFANGAWTGAGIDSSNAAADGTHRTAIGYASNAVLNKSSFKNVNGLTSGDILVKYTYYGDADLNGVVTLDDFTQFLSGYQGNGSTWLLGDFDYNGKVTLDDFTLFLDAYQNQGAPLAALDEAVLAANVSSGDRAMMLAAIQAVPEPTSLALLGIAGMGLLARRRRHA